MMGDGENPHEVTAELIDQRVGESREHELSDVPSDQWRGVWVHADAREPGFDLVRELGAKTWTLVLEVVDGVVELTTRVGVKPKLLRHLRRALASAMTSFAGTVSTVPGVYLRAAPQRLLDPELLDLSFRERLEAAQELVRHRGTLHSTEPKGLAHEFVYSHDAPRKRRNPLRHHSTSRCGHGSLGPTWQGDLSHF